MREKEREVEESRESLRGHPGTLFGSPWTSNSVSA